MMVRLRHRGILYVRSFTPFKASNEADREHARYAQVRIACPRYSTPSPQAPFPVGSWLPCRFPWQPSGLPAERLRCLQALGRETLSMQLGEYHRPLLRRAALPPRVHSQPADQMARAFHSDAP